jgi:hypothetical protein
MILWRHLRSSFFWWFGLIWAGVGTPFCVIGIMLLQADRHFNATAVPATATIVERGHSTTSKGDSSYWMRYVYHDQAGAEHVDTATVSWAVWRQHPDGSALQIRYAPERPASSKLSFDDAAAWWVLPLVFSSVGLVFGGTGWLLVLWTWGKIRARVVLLRTGMSAMATITAVEVNLSVRINGRHPRYLAYEFCDDTGRQHQGRSADLPPRLDNRWQAGDPILVVYDRLDPAKHEADIFDLKEKEPAGLRPSL